MSRFSVPFRILTVLAPLAVFASIMLVMMEIEATRNGDGSLQQAAFAATAAIERRLAAEIAVLDALATAESLDRGDLEGFREQARRHLARHPDWSRIILTDASAPVLDTSGAAGEPLPPLFPQDAGPVRTGRVSVSGILREDTGAGAPFYAIGVPVVRDGRVSYGLLAVVRAWTLHGMLDADSLPAGGHLAVLDRDMRVLALTGAADPLDRRIGGLPDRSVPEGLRGAGDGPFTAATMDGMRQVAVRTSVPPAGWTVLADVPVETIDGPLRRSMTLALAGGVTALILSTLIATRRFIRADGCRHAAERRLAGLEAERRTERRLSGIAANFPGIIFQRVLHPDGRCDYPYAGPYAGAGWNLIPSRHFAAHLAAHGGESILHAFPAFLTPESAARWQAATVHSAAELSPFDVECELNIDGETHWLRSLAQPGREPDGRVVWNGVLLNVTAQKRAEAALHLSEERVRLAVEAADLGTFDYDPASQTISFTDRCRAIASIPEAADIPGETFWQRVHPDDRAEARAALVRALDPAGSGDFAACFRALKPDGQARWVETRGRVLFTGAGDRRMPARLLGVARDVTEAHRAQASLQQAKDAAERANLAKTRFLAAASHDLRQPVQGLILLTSVLSRQVSRGGARETLDCVNEALDALKSMLDGLLDISRLDAGVMAPVVEAVALPHILQQIDAGFAPLAAAKGLGWRVTTPEVGVRTDAALIGRLLRNLVHNAIRYTDRGQVEVECRVEGAHVRILVRDTGVGIPEGQIGRIFDEFYQARRGARTQDQGLGLGLAIVRRLSTLLGHPVEVQSVPGKGSVFSVRVPLVPASPRTTRCPSTDRPALEAGGKVALVVDDDVVIRFALTATLAEWGFEVVEAASLRDAMGRLADRGRAPDVILADYNLGEETGLDVIREVRARFDRSVRAILLTGEAGSSFRPDDDLQVAQKPVSPAQLRILLAKARTGLAA